MCARAFTEREVMLNRRVPKTCVGAIATVVCWCLVTSCEIDDSEFYDTEFYLEIVNESSDSVRVQIGMKNSDFRIPADDRRNFHRRSGVLVLASNERMIFAMETHGLVPADGRFVSGLQEVYFYDEDGENPYKSYQYPGYRCNGNSTCEDAGDDTTVVHLRSDGVRENLFVESPERPFYLERDEEDVDLGRIVITYVPSAGSSIQDIG